MQAHELLNGLAVLDLETTGLDPAADEVIELGVAFVEGGKVVRRISELFGASRPLPLAIRRITGLTDEHLAGRPAFPAYLPTLREALRGWTVVAHNAAFEQSFLSEALGPIRAPVLDSCELLHLLYPELPSHSLESLIRWAGAGEGAAHRALRDCEDTLAVLRYALGRCLEEDRSQDLADLVETLAAPSAGRTRVGMAADRGAPLLALLSALHRACLEEPPPLTLAPSSLPGPPGHQRSPTAKSPAPLVDQVEALLGPGGALEQAVPGFTSRQAQRQLAREVASALAEGGQLAVEAGTGTGKSLAYLAPSALFASSTGHKVAIATHTKALQDQLMEKDLPRLHQATQGSFSYAALKGQGNYLCRRRALEATSGSVGKPDFSERCARAYLRAFLRRSPDGDLDRLSYWFKERHPGLSSLASMVRSEAQTTLAERCPHFGRCFYHSAVARAEEADLLIVNQALALSWPPRYPPIEHLVLDEAHELEDAITTASTVELTDGLLGAVGMRLLGRFGQGLLGSVSQALASNGRRQLQRLGDEVVELGEAVEQLCEGEEKRIDQAMRTTRPWLKVRDALLGVRRELEELIRLLLEAKGKLPLALERELQGVITQCQELTSFIGDLAESPDEGCCYQASDRGGRGWGLACLPIEAGPPFTRFAAQKKSLVLTSATLHCGTGSPFVLERLGLLDQAGAPRTLRLGTSFELARQALVVLVTDAPSPRSPEFTGWAAARIGGLAQFMGGRVLGLFASTRRLEEVGEAVQRALEPGGLEVLRQFHGAGRGLAARQEQDFGSVLLGTRSFWQGIDIPGRGVACVFIDKLPIEPSNRPLVQAREERLAGGGRGGFLGYRLPRALLLLRQGVGRLIRGPEDRGVVVISDPGNPSYRAELLAALEGYRVETLPWSRARVLIRDELQQMGLAAAPARMAAAGP